jgi:chemotaxis protein MotB
VSNGPWKATTLIFLLTTAAAGGYARHLQRELAKGDAAVQDHASKLAECTRIRDDERALKEKALGEASATIGATRVELDELRAERAENEKRLAAFRTLTDKFRKMIDSGKLQVALVHGRMVVKLPAGILFPSGSAELSKEGKDALHDVAVVLRTMKDRRFMVAGHTDNVPIVPPSAFKNNLELSTARAVTVAQHLVGSGMSAPQLVAAGYAEHEPVRPNTSEAGRQENRRIELVLLPNVTEMPEIPGAERDAGAPAPPPVAPAAASGSAAPAHVADAGAARPAPAPRR